MVHTVDFKMLCFFKSASHDVLIISICERLISPVPQATDVISAVKPVCCFFSHFYLFLWNYEHTLLCLSFSVQIF